MLKFYKTTSVEKKIKKTKNVTADSWIDMVTPTMDEIEVVAAGTKNVEVTALPTRANTAITYTSSNSSVFTVAADATNDRKCVVTATGDATDTATLTATSGEGEDAVTATVTIEIVAAS